MTPRGGGGPASGAGKELLSGSQPLAGLEPPPPGNEVGSGLRKALSTVPLSRIFASAWGAKSGARLFSIIGQSQAKILPDFLIGE